MSEKSKSLYIRESDRYGDPNVANTPWLEWKDSDLNSEKWDTPKDTQDGLFTDTEAVLMPRSLEPYQWIRAKDLQRLTGPLTVCSTTTVEHPDLISCNKHLLRSEFVRWFICALANLQYCGRQGLDISGENGNFVWNDRHRSWHGWMHVYSLNKAGKGAQHRPVINPNGKYIIRLHCTGCWRRVLVDDTVPVDKEGKVLLPRTCNNFELWPMLLAKALLKVASLSSTARHEIVDFNPIACLTGWVCSISRISHLQSQEKWQLLRKYSEHFQWSEEILKTDVAADGKSKETPLNETKKSQPIKLLLVLANLRELKNNGKSAALSSCCSRIIHVIQSRDVPLDPKEVKPPLARWKFHRWFNWAIERDLIDPVDYLVPIRYLDVISPLEECSEDIVRDHDDNDRKNVDIKKSFSSPELQSNKSQKTSDSSAMTEETGASIRQWIDFNRVSSYMTEAYLFYKLEHFQYSIRITSDASEPINDDHKTKATKEMKKEKGDTYNWRREILKSRNEPLYLFCDSLAEKFFLINFCVGPRKADGELCENDYLTIEEHNWFCEPNRYDRLTTITTAGVKSTGMKLQSGRQLLRIYCRSKFSLATISSDTIFHLGDRMTVQRLMTTESHRVEQLSRIISGNICRAYQSFGKKDYPTMLKNYYRSYLPDWRGKTSFSKRKKKGFRTFIHSAFMQEQIELIKTAFSDRDHKEILHSLRVFFVDPNLLSKHRNSTSTLEDLHNSTAEPSSEICDGDGNVARSRAATTIQSFFKLALVKKYQRLHDPDHALHAQIRKALLKISDLFDWPLASELLRNVIGRCEILRDLYPCSQDFRHVLQFQEFKGVLENIPHDRWLPIARFTVNAGISQTVVAAVELLVDLPRFTLRVFDNRDLREMKCTVNHVLPNRYEHLSTGYTVFAYGWSEKLPRKDLDWIVRIVTKKGEPKLYQVTKQQLPFAEIKPPKLLTEESIGTYVPNVNNRISKWSVRATSRTVVSIRLTTSYNLAEIRLKVTDEEGKVLANKTGNCTVLLPVIIFEDRAGMDEDEETFRNATPKKHSYYVEAFVLNDSWPLTDDEWTVANQARTKVAGDLEARTQFGNVSLSKTGLSTSRRSFKQSVNGNQSLKPPYWILQVVTDAGDIVEVCQDKSREREIALLKESWWSNEPDRPERGRKLREAFTKTCTSRTEDETDGKRKDSTISLDDEEDAALCLSREELRRTLKSPESHLLPVFNLTKYTRRDKKIGDCRDRMPSGNELLKKQHTVSELHRDHFGSAEDLDEIINERSAKYRELLKRIGENFRQRRDLVDGAFESRKIRSDSVTMEKEKMNKGKRK